MVNFRLNILQIESILVDFELDPFISYLKESEQMIIEQQSKLEERFKRYEKEQVPDMPEAIDIFYDEMGEKTKFKKILHNSVFLMLYSSFESHFVTICNHCKVIDNLKISVKDLSGRNYIGQCRNYITKVSEVNLDSLQNEWNEINKLQKIRNSITHKSGKIIEIKPDLKNYILNTDGISYNEKENEIRIDSILFLENFVLLIKKFMNNLINEIISQKK